LDKKYKKVAPSKDETTSAYLIRLENNLKKRLPHLIRGILFNISID